MTKFYHVYTPTFEGHAGTDAASAGTDASARRAPHHVYTPTFEGHAGTDAASAGTDASARRAPQTAGSEQRRTPQAATCPDAAADGRHQEGRRDYGITAPDAPIPSFRLHCRAMEGLSATL